MLDPLFTVALLAKPHTIEMDGNRKQTEWLTLAAVFSLIIITLQNKAMNTILVDLAVIGVVKINHDHAC